MAQLRRDYDEFRRRDAEVVVAGPEGSQAFADYWAANDLPFVGLPDLEHLVLKLYGQRVNLFRFGRMPAQLIIDRAGYVRYVHYGHAMDDIPTNAELLALLDTLNATDAE